jgi:hypothetical protein
MSSSPSLALVDRLIDESFPTFHGWCTPEKAKRMARLVTELPLSRTPLCVELGVFGGRGCFALGLAVKHCLNGIGHVDGIDPFTAAASLEGTNAKPDQDWWAKVDYGMILESARAGVARLGLDGIVRFIVKRSQDVVGVYAEKSIDMLHQDSNHSLEVSCYEVETWVPKMKPKGFWVFDDINWPSTHLAQSHLVTRHGFSLIESYETWAIYQAP